MCVTKKLLRYFLLFIFLIVAIVTGISYHIIRVTCSRAVFSEKKKERILKKRAFLVNQMGGKPVSFVTVDGIKLSGLLFNRPHATKVIVAAHGYFSNKEAMMHVVDMFPDDHVLLFDFRGHSQSGGNIISIGYHERKDITSAVKFLQQQKILNSLPLIGIGNSMGSATLIGAVVEGVPFDVLVLDSSFARLEKQLDDTFTVRTGLPKKPFLSIAMKLCQYMNGGNIKDVNPVEWIQHVVAPVLLIHSDVDELVPLFDAQKIYDNANDPKELWIVSNAVHGDVWKVDYDRYKQRIVEFVNKHIDQIEKNQSGS